MCIYIYILIGSPAALLTGFAADMFFVFFESVQRPSKTSISISSNVISVLLPAMFAIATFDRVSSELL